MGRGGGGGGGKEIGRQEKPYVYVSGYVINATVKGFARKCCATKICNLLRQGCNQHVEDCLLSDREISETLLSIRVSPTVKELPPKCRRVSACLFPVIRCFIVFKLESALDC